MQRRRTLQPLGIKARPARADAHDHLLAAENAATPVPHVLQQTVLSRRGGEEEKRRAGDGRDAQRALGRLRGRAQPVHRIGTLPLQHRVLLLPAPIWIVRHQVTNRARAEVVDERFAQRGDGGQRLLAALALLALARGTRTHTREERVAAAQWRSVGIVLLVLSTREVDDDRSDASCVLVVIVVQILHLGTREVRPRAPLLRLYADRRAHLVTRTPRPHDGHRRKILLGVRWDAAQLAHARRHVDRHRITL
eukprot:1237201-Prymnesium_polylepis.1